MPSTSHTVISMPSTSQINDNKIHSERDHTYSNIIKKKKTTKSSRLTDSIDISKHLLESVDNRNDLLNSYYKEKIKLMQKKQEYMDRKIEIQSSILNTLIEIKDCLLKK